MNKAATQPLKKDVRGSPLAIGDTVRWSTPTVPARVGSVAILAGGWIADDAVVVEYVDPIRGFQYAHVHTMPNCLEIIEKRRS